MPMSRRMENGNAIGPARADDPKDHADRLGDTTEDANEATQRRSTFGRPVPTSGAEDENNEGLRRGDVAYDAPEEYVNLDEVAADPEGSRLEDSRGRGRGSDDIEVQDEQNGTIEPPRRPAMRVSRWATELYTLSYLVFFAIFGTLARLGLQALTTYPDAPVSFGVLWANVGGSLVMGFLAEDRKLFRHEWGTATYDEHLKKARRQRGSGGSAVDLAAAKKAHLAVKKTIPLYIGLATGFCGSFTSFSSFIRDVFLAMSNDLPGAGDVAPGPRNGGYSFMAMLAVIIATVGLSLSGLLVGAHLAAALEPVTPSIPYPLGRRVLDPVAVVLGWGCWLGAVLLSIWPPHDAWRGRAVFSLVFAPLGCLARFYVSMWLNPRIPAFPLGTFAVNIVGVAVLGMCWDLGHEGIGGLVGCQVLQGVEDGFCGCLTTVSTWVAELAALRRRHAYTYGTVSVVAGFAIMVIIMGGLRWSDGFGPLKCTH